MTPHKTLPEKILFDEKFPTKDEMTKVYMNQMELGKKINQVIDFLSQEECVCKEPDAKGVTHRKDGPCYITPSSPQTESWEEELKKAGLTASQEVAVKFIINQLLSKKDARVREVINSYKIKSIQGEWHIKDFQTYFNSSLDKILSTLEGDNK